MGITIHYTLISKNSMKVNEALKITRKFIEKQGYKIEDYEEEGILQYSWFGKIIEDNNEPKRTIQWLKEKYGEMPIILKTKEIKQDLQDNLIFNVKKPIGAVILTEDYYYWGVLWFYPHWLLKRNNWEIRGYETRKRGFIINTTTTETFSLLFYRFHDYFVCEEFCKTQPFNDYEFLPNIKHHINFCDTLQLVAEQMNHAYISDEGGYYETHDTKRLMENFGLNAELIWGLASQLELQFPDESFRFEVGGKYDIKKKFKKEP